MNANPPTPEQIAAMLWARVVASYANDPRNDVEPFATGVD